MKPMMTGFGFMCLVLFFACKNTQNLESTAVDTMNDHSPNLETATFAGGCFWCLESDFEKTDGVVEALSGYAGGHKQNPTYEEVSSGETGHVEAVQVTYDTTKVTYDELLEVFWRHINPTDAHGQFVDRGSQYRTVIFYHNEAQRRAAEASKAKLGKSGPFDDPIVTEIVKSSEFYRAEDYHQDYFRRNPNQRYCQLVIRPKLDKFEKVFRLKLDRSAL